VSEGGLLTGHARVNASEDTMYNHRNYILAREHAAELRRTAARERLARSACAGRREPRLAAPLRLALRPALLISLAAVLVAASAFAVRTGAVRSAHIRVAYGQGHGGTLVAFGGSHGGTLIANGNGRGGTLVAYGNGHGGTLVAYGESHGGTLVAPGIGMGA
jgi:hypothetical protein